MRFTFSSGLTLFGSLFTLAALCFPASAGYAQDVFVNGYQSNTINEYTSTGTFVREFVSAGSGGLVHAQGMAFGPDGNLYVTSGFGTGSTAVKKYNGTTGAFLGDFVTGLSGPTDVALDGAGNAYVAEYSANRVRKFSSAGALLQTYTSNVTSPYGLTLRPTGTLLVTNYGNASSHSVTEIDPLSGIGTNFATGIGAGVGITGGSDGRYYVGDYNFDGGSNSVKVIGASGGAAATWNSPGALVGASYLTFEGGDLFVTSYYNSLVNRFDGSTGAFLGSFDGPTGTSGIAVQTAFVSTPVTPEPGSLAFLTGLSLAGGLVAFRRRR